MVICVKCGRQRKIAYMQEAVFRGFCCDEGVGIYKCSASASCKGARKANKKRKKEIV